MGSRACVRVFGTLGAQESQLDLWVFCVVNGYTIETSVAEGLAKARIGRTAHATSVFPHVFAAMAKEGGDGLYVSTEPVTDAYRTVEVNCNNLTVRVTSIYSDDPERNYPAIQAFIDDVRFRNFHPTWGAKVRVAKLLDNPDGLQDVYSRYLETRELEAVGEIIALLPTETGQVWLVQHEGSGFEIGAYTVDELMPR